MSADKSGLEIPWNIGRQNICDIFTIYFIRATDTYCRKNQQMTWR